MAGTYVIRRTYTATKASKGIYISGSSGLIGPIQEWNYGTQYYVGDYCVNIEGVFRCTVDHVADGFRMDLGRGYWINEYSIAGDIIDDGVVSTSLTWSSSKITSFVNAYKVKSGEGVFPGYKKTSVSISHGLISVPSYFAITPYENTDGKLGEYWVEYMDANTFKVGNTGDSGIRFKWMAIG